MTDERSAERPIILSTLAPAPAGKPFARTNLFCAVVAMTSLIEIFDALMDLKTIGNVGNSPDVSPSGLAALAAMAAHLLFALAALGFAVAMRLRLGIATLAVLALAGWASDLSLLLDGTPNLQVGAFRTFNQPLLSALSLAAVCLNRHLGAAAMAVAAISIINVADFALFAIAVGLYGF